MQQGYTDSTSTFYEKFTFKYRERTVYLLMLVADRDH